MTDFNALAGTDKAEAFANAVADINTRGKSLQLDIQLYLHAVAVRWAETGDVRPAVGRINMLTDKKALFKGVRRNALVAWVEDFMGFAYILEGENAHTFHANGAKAKGMDLAVMAKQENHWYNHTAEPDPAPVFLNVLLAQLVKKAETRKAKNKSGDVFDDTQLAALKALIVPEQDSLEASLEALETIE